MRQRIDDVLLLLMAVHHLDLVEVFGVGRREGREREEGDLHCYVVLFDGVVRFMFGRFDVLLA